MEDDVNTPYRYDAEKERWVPTEQNFTSRPDTMKKADKCCIII